MQKVLFYNQLMDADTLHKVIGHSPKDKQSLSLVNYCLGFKGVHYSNPTISYKEGYFVTCVMYTLSDKDIEKINDYMECPDVYSQDYLKIGDDTVLCYRVREVYPDTLPDASYEGEMDGIYYDLKAPNEVSIAKVIIRKQLEEFNNKVKVLA